MNEKNDLCRVRSFKNSNKKKYYEKEISLSCH